METISRLREALVRVLTQDELQQGDQELFEELMVQKPRLLKLLDVGQRSAQEQKEVESGKINFNGRQVAVNSDFSQQVIFLAQQLDCSEKYVASVLHTVMTTNPNLEPVGCIEGTVAEFHLRRRLLVDSVEFLLAAAELADKPGAPPTYTRLARFVRGELLPAVPTAGGEVTLAFKIFKEIGNLDNLIAKTDVARKSATSHTVAPSAQGQAVLGYDILNGRYESLAYERRHLSISLSSIARHGYLSPNEIKLFVDWLSTNANHPMALYILTAVLISFDPLDPSTRIGSIRQKLATDPSLMIFMTKKLAPSTEWKEPGLKAAVLLKWTMFLTEARHNDASLEHRTGFKTEELETQVWNAVQGDAFLYLALAVIHIQKKHGESPPASLVTGPPSETPDQREIPPNDFELVVLSGLETLVRSVITHASSELRKIKQRQEDLVLATARSDRNRVSSRFAATLAQETDKTGQPPRHDISIFYSFIGLLFSALPEERALQFWGSGAIQESSQMSYLEHVESTSGRLPTFLQWAVWSTAVQDLTMLTSLYDMLNGLSKGQQCSELTYNFMARGSGEVLPGSMLSTASSTGPSVSWAAIFGLLESWAISSANPRSHAQPQPLGFNSSFTGSLQNLAPPPPPSQQITIGPKDVLLAQSFLRLLSSVVKYSVAVRTTIAGHAHFRAIPTLLSLIPLGIPLELKGALFNTISSFCGPGAGVPGVEICKAVWTLMERLEVINVRGSAGGLSSALAPGKGVEVELEQIEAVHRLYPATIPFLNLLSTLIHTAKRLPSKDRAAGLEPSNTIPESLGQPYRLPGVGPFTSFVVDNVFANISNREYSQPSDRWRTNDICLCYVERALASFNLESLVNSFDDTPFKSESIIPLLVHPGYDIMTRLLSSSQLQASLLAYIVDGLDGFEKGLADEEPFFRNTIVRVLRIVHRVLEIQDIFLDVLLPLLSDSNSLTIVGQVHHRSYFTKFDQALSFGPQHVPSLAQYMEYTSHTELVLLSIKILTILSTSPFFSNLVTLVERSSSSERILAGFKHTLTAEIVGDIAQVEAIAEETTGAGAPDVDAEAETLIQAIRLYALDLIIQDTHPSRPYPNLGHFLLFGSLGNHQQIQDPNALHSRQVSIHVLLDLVNAGVPRLKGKRKEPEFNHLQNPPLFQTFPALAERCYHVIFQLCTHPRTSDFTTRYLRTREDFFARQISFVSSQAPETHSDVPINVVYGDSSRVSTTVDSLSSFLRLRSYIFDLVALELHILTTKGHFKGVTEILEILFGTDFEYEEEHDFATFREVGQSNMRVIDFFQSLLFDWSDSLQVTPTKLQYLGQLNLQVCIRKDATGCEIVDRTRLLQMLAAAKHTLISQGSIVTSSQNDQLSEEMSYILESCAVENHRRKVAHSFTGGFESWRRLLDLALTKCFDRLPHDRRENMLFDLLHVLPAAIRSPNIEESTAVLLSEEVLSLVTKLREDRRHQLILYSSGSGSESGSLPAERLYTILRNVVEGIQDSNHAELVRGNLYASLINFVHLVMSSQEPTHASDDQNSPFAMSLSSSSMRDSPFSTSQSIVSLCHSTRTNSTSSLELGILSVLKPSLERLVASISRDAIDGTEVWKTIAFMLLDSIVQLSGLEKHHTILSALVRHGILANFIRGVKEADTRLQSILKPDPDDLNPLYVYEAKMSLFIRMAQTRPGAERLLEAHLIPTLAQCDYLDAMPESDQSFMDNDSFLPSAIQRYHQLLMPAVQVVDCMLAVLGSKHTTATTHSLDFLSNHASTLAILLKTEADFVTLAVLEEIHLVVALCTSLLPSVPKSELLSSNSGFGAIHAAILALSTRCLGQGKAFVNIVPQTDSEVQMNKIHAFGFGSDTKFTATVRRKEWLLRKSIISYIGAASEFTEPEITLVLSPVTTTPKRDDRGSHFSATVPTVGDALIALDDLCHDLAGVLKQMSDIQSELVNKDHIGVSDVKEILRDVDSSLLQELEIEQTRSLICQELESIGKIVHSDAKIVLDTTEMLLLLIWRHLDHYAEPKNMNLPPAKVSITNAMRLLATAEPEVFRAEVGSKLSSALQRLTSLEINEFLVGQDWQDNHGYIEIMCRRLRDSAGLLDDAPPVERD